MIGRAGLRRVGVALVVAVPVVAGVAARVGAQPVDCNQLPAGMTDCVRDADCTAPACGDWSVNGAAGETCDDGNVADGDSCSSLCACDDVNDADGDGIGDECDDCVATPDGAVLSVLGLKNIGTDPVVGDDGLGLKMEAALGAGVTFGDLDPVADSVGLALHRGSGAPLLALAIPSGAFDGTVGWRANASATAWSFVDKSPGPVATGVRKARLLDRGSAVPGGGAGRCAERDHDRVDCRVSAAGDGVKCRR